MRIFIGVTEVIGSTPSTLTSFNCSTKPRIALSSPVIRSASSSLTAMRAKCATRLTVEISTDILFSANAVSGRRPATLTVLWYGYNGAIVEAQHFLRAKPKSERVNRTSGIGQNLRTRMVGHASHELVRHLIDDRKRCVMAWQHGFEVEIALAGESRHRSAH